MCHLLLAAPLFTLPLFLVLPWPVAALVNAPVILLSALLYALTVRVLREPTHVGAESLVGAAGEVAESKDGRLRVRVQGELWTARASQDLREGEQVTVVARDGLRLRVRRP